QKVAPEHAKLSDVNIELRHPEAAGGLDRESHADGGPGRDASELGDEKEGRPIAEPAGGKQHADGVVWIAAQIVQQARVQHQGRERQHSHDEGDQGPDGKVAIEQQARVEEGPLGGEAMGDEDPEGEYRNEGADHDLRRVKPVEALAAVKDKLSSNDGRGK